MRNREPNTTFVIPAEILELLGLPPVRSPEDVKRWYAVFDSIARWLRPKDIFEWFWAWDLTAERWEMDRQRKTKVVLNAVQRAIVEERAGMKQTKAEALLEASLKAWAYPRSGELAQREPPPPPPTPRPIEVSPETAENVPDLTQSLTEVACARQLAEWSDLYNCADKLESAAQKRFEAIYHQIALHRAGLGLQISPLADEIIDGEFEKIEGPPQEAHVLAAPKSTAPAQPAVGSTVEPSTIAAEPAFSSTAASTVTLTPTQLSLELQLPDIQGADTGSTASAVVPSEEPAVVGEHSTAEDRGAAPSVTREGVTVETNDVTIGRPLEAPAAAAPTSMTREEKIAFFQRARLARDKRRAAEAARSGGEALE
jgi:hypothetical protein